jgi:hypothetical protein
MQGYSLRHDPDPDERRAATSSDVSTLSSVVSSRNLKKVICDEFRKKHVEQEDICETSYNKNKHI